jgi:putative nucleotidyltransferase with HDIG domain
VVPASIDPDVRRRLERHIDNLPVLPLALAHLLALDPSDDDYFESVIGILESEPNFAARLLVAANSAESSPTQPVTTLAGAVARIGSRGATNLVLALSVTKVFVPRDPWEQSLWRHGVQVAHAARALARFVSGGDEPLNPEEVYACALLHDLGRFVFFQEAPDVLRAVDEGDWDSPQALIEQELEICGLSHAEVGAMACTKWRLPDIVVRVVRHHHDPLPGQITSLDDKVVAIVRLADLAMFPSAKPGAESLAQTLTAPELAVYLAERTPPFLALPGPQLAQIVEEARAEADQACAALGIADR